MNIIVTNYEFLKNCTDSNYYVWGKCPICNYRKLLPVNWAYTYGEVCCDEQHKSECKDFIRSYLQLSNSKLIKLYA